MFLGYRLKKLRKDKKISQFELGKILGVSKVSISGYENGTRVPSMDKLLSILDFFDISADFLLGREVNAVCESDNRTINLSNSDIEIIKELHAKPIIYNTIAVNPKRFFTAMSKKKI